MYCSRQLYTFSEGEEKKRKRNRFRPENEQKRIFRPFFRLMLVGNFFVVMMMSFSHFLLVGACPQLVELLSWTSPMTHSIQDRDSVSVRAQKSIKNVTNWNFHFSPLSFHAHGCHIWCNCCLSRSWTSSKSKVDWNVVLPKKKVYTEISCDLGRNSKSILAVKKFFLLFFTLEKEKSKKVEEEKSLKKKRIKILRIQKKRRNFSSVADTTQLSSLSGAEQKKQQWTQNIKVNHRQD